MTKRMLVDATHPEETRVAIVDSYRDINRLDDLDFDLASKPLLKGNIYLAKVMRVEPSLQAAFVEYGGNRHGFLSFTEIHPDYFRIPMADRPADEEGEDGQSESEELPENLNEEIPEEPDYENEPSEHAVPYTPEDEFAAPSETPVQEAPQEPQTAPVQETIEPVVAEPRSPLDSPFAQAESTGLADPDVGLITDFGNAAVPDATPLDGAAPTPEQTPLESVGGEVTERFVRRPPRPRYKIQEVVKRGQVMLVQVVKEERGNKGAALTTFLSLAGRYCVLMPNTDHGGGVSRKITNHQDRRRMKEILDQLEIPEGMAVILRTAGMEQDPKEIQRDLEYLLRMWNSIREQTLQSTAPSLIYEEANLIKRSVRDLYSQDISEILVSGEVGYQRAREFMQTIMPDDVDKIKLYNDPIPLFFRYNVENQIDGLHNPVVQLRSGGYLVINPTEALVSIDVNSGRATRERHIEETALKTNLEAADEIARQLRLRDLAGLVVIDYIDMEDGRNNSAVERRMKEAMKNDRARLQIGRLSLFGLMELSRQRLRPSLLEINCEKCPHCAGAGFIRSVDSAALSVLRVIEEEGIKQRSSEVIVSVPTRIALYLLNQKRVALSAIEQRYEMHVLLQNDDTLVQPDHKIERVRTRHGKANGPAVNTDQVLAEAERELPPIAHNEGDEPVAVEPTADESAPRRQGRRRMRDRFGRRDKNNRRPAGPEQQQTEQAAPVDTAPLPETEGLVAENAPGNAAPYEGAPDGHKDDGQQRRRRRGRRGGRRRNNDNREGGDHWEKHPRYAQGQTSSVPSDNDNAFLPSGPIEIDTTPRVDSPVRNDPSRQTVRQQSSTAEIVNPPTDKPKGGWWRRLTGQEN